MEPSPTWLIARRSFIPAYSAGDFAFLHPKRGKANTVRVCCLGLLLFLGGVSHGTCLAVQPETLSFNHDVRPILSRYCLVFGLILEALRMIDSQS